MVTSRSSTSLLQAAALPVLFTAVLATAPAVFADDAQSNRVHADEKVTYEELDLNKEAGVNVLYERLQKAAERVCGLHAPMPHATTIKAAADRHRCYQDALDRAVSSVDVPSLTEKHAG